MSHIPSIGKDKLDLIKVNKTTGAKVKIAVSP